MFYPGRLGTRPFLLLPQTCPPCEALSTETGSQKWGFSVGRSRAPRSVVHGPKRWPHLRDTNYKPAGRGPQESECSRGIFPFRVNVLWLL